MDEKVVAYIDGSSFLANEESVPVFIEFFQNETFISELISNQKLCMEMKFKSIKVNLNCKLNLIYEINDEVITRNLDSCDIEVCQDGTFSFCNYINNLQSQFIPISELINIDSLDIKYLFNKDNHEENTFEQSINSYRPLIVNKLNDDPRLSVLNKKYLFLAYYDDSENNPSYFNRRIFGEFHDESSDYESAQEVVDAAWEEVIVDSEVSRKILKRVCNEMESKLPKEDFLHLEELIYEIHEDFVISLWSKLPLSTQIQNLESNTSPFTDDEIEFKFNEIINQVKNK